MQLISKIQKTMARIPTRYDMFILAVLGGLLSVGVSGFVFGTNNNVFHLPIVASLYDQPQFAGDAFIQSLRHFSSGIWMIFAGSAAWIDPSTLFACLNILSRILVCMGALLWAELLGVTTRKEKSLFTLLLVLTPLLMRTTSYAGGGGLFIPYFSHSEMANGVTLIALYYAMKGRYASSLAANGIVFFINAFIGVWNCVPIALIALWKLHRKEDSLKTLLVRGGLGSLVFIMLSLPVICAIIQNPDFGSPKSFEYVAYLKEYWPFHFLFAEVRTFEKAALALIFILGWQSLSLLGARASYAHIALAGYGLVYLCGIVVPYFSQNSFILNLHLLRVSTFIHLITAIAAIALALTWLRDKDRFNHTFMAPGLAFLLCSHKLFLFLAPFAVMAQRIPVVRHVVVTYLGWMSRFILPLSALGILAFQTSSFLAARTYQTSLKEWNTEILAMGHWAQTHTSPQAVFLVPFDDIRPGKARSREKQPDMALFHITFQRRMWVDYKTGAAVMWQPSYYTEWHTRKEDVLALASLDAKLAYAQHNGISYVLELCTREHTTTVTPVFKTQRLCLFQTPINHGDNQ